MKKCKPYLIIFLKSIIMPLSYYLVILLIATNLKNIGSLFTENDIALIYLSKVQNQKFTMPYILIFVLWFINLIFFFLQYKKKRIYVVILYILLTIGLMIFTTLYSQFGDLFVFQMIDIIKGGLK